MSQFIVETSARHVHVTQETLEILFGAGHTLTPIKDLSQPGQFASEEQVDVVGPKNTIKRVRILGPVRPDNQVELALTDARSIGVTAPVRESGDIKGFENWSGQTQLLIRVDGNNTVDYSGYTWKITIANGETAKTITLVPSSAQAPWLYRFETCVAEGDNQFIPVNGTEYTISVEILNDAGEVIAQSGRRNGFIPFQEPIVPEEPIDPPVDPGEGDDDEPGQTGDAAVYATIAVAVAAVALAVVFKRRSAI